MKTIFATFWKMFVRTKWVWIFVLCVGSMAAITFALTAYSMRQTRHTQQEAKAFDRMVVRVLDLQVLQRTSSSGYAKFRVVVENESVPKATRFVWYVQQDTQAYTFLEEKAIVPGDSILVTYNERYNPASSGYAGIFDFLTFSQPPP